MDSHQLFQASSVQKEAMVLVTMGQGGARQAP